MPLKKFYLGALILILTISFVFLRRERDTKKYKSSGEEEVKFEELSKIKRMSIITLYDNYRVKPQLDAGWGFSCLLRIDNQSILFDTGADSKTLLENMEKIGVKEEK